MRYDRFRERLLDAVLSAPGITPREVRQAVVQRGPLQPLPLPSSPLAAYADKVALHAYKVTDDDIAALQRAGYSDDAVFEITVAAAVGAALHRLDRGMAALRGEEPD
jgi:alkylhydroperoxidase family enzyme